MHQKHAETTRSYLLPAGEGGRNASPSPMGSFDRDSASGAPSTNRGARTPPNVDFSLRNPLWTSDNKRAVSARFDWFTICGKGHQSEVQAIAQDWFEDLRECGKFGFYAGGFRSALGTRVGLNHNMSPDSWQVMIPGREIAELDEATQAPVCELLKLPTAHLTRLDAAIDLRHPMMPQRLPLALKPHMPRLRRGGSIVEGVGEQDGVTAYLGSKSSDSFVRFYDKGAEQDSGPNWWYRWESVYQREYAKSYSKKLLETNDWASLCQAIAAAAVPKLETICPGLHRTLFDSKLEPINLSQHDQNIEKWRDHCQNAVMKRLALYAEQVLGSDSEDAQIELMRKLGLFCKADGRKRDLHSGIIFSLRALIRG